QAGRQFVHSLGGRGFATLAAALATAAFATSLALGALAALAFRTFAALAFAARLVTTVVVVAAVLATATAPWLRLGTGLALVVTRVFALLPVAGTVAAFTATFAALAAATAAAAAAAIAVAVARAVAAFTASAIGPRAVAPSRCRGRRRRGGRGSTAEQALEPAKEALFGRGRGGHRGLARHRRGGRGGWLLGLGHRHGGRGIGQHALDHRLLLVGAFLAAAREAGHVVHFLGQLVA